MSTPHQLADFTATRIDGQPLALADLVGKAGLIMVAHGEEMLRQFCTAGILLDGGRAQWFDRIGDALAAYKGSLQA